MASHAAPVQRYQVKVVETVAVGLNSQLWACSVSPGCGKPSGSLSATIEAVEDWLSPGRVPGFAPAAAVVRLSAWTKSLVGKSFLAITLTRYLPPCLGTTKEALVSSLMSVQVVVQSCHWYSNSIVGVPFQPPSEVTVSTSPCFGSRLEIVGLVPL